MVLGTHLLLINQEGGLLFLSESKELAEEEEGAWRSHLFEDEKIKQTGAGGSGLEERKTKLLQESVSEARTFFQPLYLVYFYRDFSFITYHNFLLQTLYLPKLYILFHCNKVFHTTLFL